MPKKKKEKHLLKVYTQNSNDVNKTYEIDEKLTESLVWKMVGENLLNIKSLSKRYIDVLVIELDNQEAQLEVGVRGSFIKDGVEYPSMYVKEKFNNILLDPSDYEEAYLTCINPESNNYKFYWLKPDNVFHELNATYGRIGSQRGEMFGTRDLITPYASYLYWIRYYEKLSKGYTDQTDIYLKSEKASSKTSTKEEIEKEDDSKINKDSIELYEILKQAAHHIVSENLVSAVVTEQQVIEIRKLLNKLNETTTVQKFNDILMKIMVLSPRRMRDVSWFLAQTSSDFNKIYLREENLLSAMEALIDTVPTTKKSSRDQFRNLGIKVYEATDKQKEEVMKHLGDGLDQKVLKIYRVINTKSKKRFDAYLKANNIKRVRQFWHGSTNENWLSIIQNGLQIHPNAKITGKMFGYGIYFAPRARKSYGYTSCTGSYWARGSEKHGFMGLYATAYGHPAYVNRSGNFDESYLKSIGKDCVCAKASNTGLCNDEIIFYNEDAMTINYIVEFSD